MSVKGKSTAENKIKDEVLAMLKGCDEQDLKEIVAELSEQFTELWARTEVFNKEIKALVSTLSAALYFYSISNLALQDLLIESGTITREGLRAKISCCPAKANLAEYLGLNFLNYPGIENVDKGRLAKWLDPLALDKFKRQLQ